ncbi:MAG: hypothetical protein LUE31_06625 [Lachnospiraceae bacterium]|nr:hypothetical protein [Lachnospiraceae bacterium]
MELQKEEYRDSLAQCCGALRCMGLNRTRGMGEVKAELIEDGSREKAFSCEAEYDPQASYCRMDYRMELRSPLLCKSVAGGQARTMDYIDGAKMLGLIAQSAGAEFLLLMEKGELICSNVYVCGPEGRCLPLSASVYRVKNEKKSGRDRAAEDEKCRESVQLSAAGDKYMYKNGQEITIHEVETQIRYHHSRPADKSIGHVSKSDAENQMYQLESLSEGQSFAGCVLGTPEQIHQVFALLKSQSHFRLGYNRSAEYGDVRLVVTGFAEEGRKLSHMAERFFVKLNAPAILYNRYGMYSTDEKDLLREVERILGVEGLRIEKRFLKYIEVGGYNTTWDARKPTILAFDKGTALLCEADRPIDIGVCGSGFIGERCSEGYGEIEIVSAPTAYELQFRETGAVSAAGESMNAADCELLRSLRKKAAESDLENRAAERARGMRSFVNSQNAAAVVSQMILMFQEQDSSASFQGAIRERYEKRTDSKQAKLKMAESVLLQDEDFARLREEVSSSYGGVGITEQEAYRWYYGALLYQLKYDVRHIRQGGES